MSRTITIRFLDAARTRAEVTITHAPSWLERLFGSRATRKIAILAYAEYMLYPDIGPQGGTRAGWGYEIDSRPLADRHGAFSSDEDREILGAVEWRRRWDSSSVEPLPQARVVPHTDRKPS